MTITRDVVGIVYTDTMVKKVITVRMTKDTRGKSMSLADEVGNIMLVIPIEPIENELKKIMK